MQSLTIWMLVTLHTQKQKLDHALVIPQNYSVGWVLSKVDNDSKAFAMYGCANDKMKNWDTKADGYTSEEKGVAEQIKAFTEAQA